MKAVWPNGWETKGHYAPGMISNGMLYISGQLPFDHDTGKMNTGTAGEQAKIALKNIESVLIAAGLTKESVVQCRIYISNIGYWDEVNAVYAEFFGEHKAARAVVPTRELHYGAVVEIEAVAEMKG